MRKFISNKIIEGMSKDQLLDRMDNLIEHYEWRISNLQRMVDDLQESKIEIKVVVPEEMLEKYNSQHRNSHEVVPKFRTNIIPTTGTYPSM